MIESVTHLTVVVEDVDAAIEWYTDALGFDLVADEEFGPGMRWVTVAPSTGSTQMVLQEPNPGYHGEERATRLREQIGANTMTVLGVDDRHATVETLESRGVDIVTPPEEMPWGVHAVIRDLYGNPYDLVEQR